MTEPSSRPFVYRQRQLSCGNTSLESLARRFGTPLYVYDWDTIAGAVAAYRQAFSSLGETLICAAVKANGNLALLQKLAGAGTGFDIVSGGELERVQRAGGAPDRVVFSGVGKTAAEMDAALRAGILLFNVESEPELELLAERARKLRRQARFGIRVNPDVAAETHPHISTGLHRHKFGVDAVTALRLYRRSARLQSLEPVGISFHIGSQILDPQPFGEAVGRLAVLVRKLRREGFPIAWLDVGGGLGISYHREQHMPTVAAYAAAVGAGLDGLECRLILEPGRRLVGAAGALLTRVLYVKRSGQRHFVITDAASNDLIRPALYSAYHEILPLHAARSRQLVDVVGPVCETGDYFARDRELARLRPGDYLAILDAGAYGFSQSSNYNTRPRAAEVLLEGGRARLVRRRETIEDLLAPELLGLKKRG